MGCVSYRICLARAPRAGAQCQWRCGSSSSTPWSIAHRPDVSDVSAATGQRDMFKLTTIRWIEESAVRRGLTAELHPHVCVYCRSALEAPACPAGRLAEEGRDNRRTAK